MKNDSDATAILLVDDNQVDIDLTLMAFSRINFTKRVQIARDGAETLEIIRSWGVKRSSTPKLILLDINIPKINGLEVLKELKESDKTKSIPVVMLTSSNNDADINKAYEFGANSYLIKPIDFDKFILLTRVICDYWIQLNVKPEEKS